MRKLSLGCLVVALVFAYLAIQFMNDPVQFVGVILGFFNPDLFK